MSAYGPKVQPRASVMNLLFDNLISPVVLSFVLGGIAKFARSDLDIPNAIYQTLSVYLLFAIGLKGGVALSQTPIGEIVYPSLATVLLGIVTPLIAYFLLRGFGKLDKLDAGATAAHYGSVSAVTFLAATEAAKYSGMAPNAFLPALVAILEVPGILVGLLLAQSGPRGGFGKAIHELVAGKSIFLLIGGTLIGWLCGAEKISGVAPFFFDPFKGVLCLFLLELGMVAASRLRDLKKAGWRLIVLGCVLPVVNGLLGTLAGSWAGMSSGGAAVLGAMAASASYIAAPAAVRIALPKASPGIYLTMSLGITFPFNLAFGIPFFLWLSQRL